MSQSGFIIITCPKCGIKNRVKSYNPDKTPVCPRCRTQLVSRDQNEVHSRYGKSEEAFHNLPGIGLRSRK